LKRVLFSPSPANMVGLPFGVAEKAVYITVGKLRHANDASVLRMSLYIYMLDSACLTILTRDNAKLVAHSHKKCFRGMLSDIRRKMRLITRNGINLTKKEATLMRYQFWLEDLPPAEIVGSMALDIERDCDVGSMG
jgi:hypothetical protein